MKKVFITSIAEQRELKPQHYITDKQEWNIDHETPYPIFHLMENGVDAEDELVLIAIKLPGENFDKNLEILKTCVEDFKKQTKAESMTCVIVERPMEEDEIGYMELFKRLVAAIPDNCRIETDITYGTRPAIPVIFAALTYALRFKFNVEIADVIYGKLDWNVQPPKSYLCDATSLFKLNFLLEDLAAIGGDHPEEAAKLLFGIK